MRRLALGGILVAGTALMLMAASQFVVWHHYTGVHNDDGILEQVEVETRLWSYRVRAADYSACEEEWCSEAEDGETLKVPWWSEMFDDHRDVRPFRWAGPLWSLSMVALSVGAIGMAQDKRWLAIACTWAAAVGVGATLYCMVGGSMLFGEDLVPGIGFWLGLAAWPLTIAAAVMASLPRRHKRAGDRADSGP